MLGLVCKDPKLNVSVGKCGSSLDLSILKDDLPYNSPMDISFSSKTTILQ